jgi:hypothetical protein
LEAICLGSAVPRHDFDAEVHSAFNHAANLRLRKNKHLVTLVTAGEADLPQGIRVGTPAQFSFEDWERGETILCRDGILWYQAKGIEIDLCQAKRWTCVLAALGLRMTDPDTSAAWKVVADVCADRWKFEVNANLAGQTAALVEIQKNALELAEATRRNDSVAGINIAAKLVGLGPGLTPAGDDFLVGFLAGLWSTAGVEKERSRFLAGFARAVVRFSRRTNDISRAYLFHAVHGQVSSRLADLVEAISEYESPECLCKTAEMSMQAGHISGMAVTAGLLFGLSAWDAPFSRQNEISLRFGKNS